MPQAETFQPPPQQAPQPPQARIDPLDYMLAVMNDPEADKEMRARMAVAAAPYVHAKAGEQGKKAQKHEAAKKVASRFGASAPPPTPGRVAH